MNLQSSRLIALIYSICSIMYEPRLENPADFVMDVPDWQQLELLSKIPEEQRISTMLATAEWVFSGIRGAFSIRFPQLSQNAINMRTLAYLTSLKNIDIEEIS